MKKVWITKWALSEGILEKVGIPTSANSMIRSDGIVFCGNEWHETRKAAVARAEAMRARKIASLRKQISKLEAIKFE